MSNYTAWRATYQSAEQAARAAFQQLDKAARALQGGCPHGSLEVMGNIQIDKDGELQSYPRAMVITFDSDEAIRSAIAAGKCTFDFKGES